MFKEIFATMNEALDSIMKDYATSGAELAKVLEEEFNLLKMMSDYCLEEWLRFEERLSECRTRLAAGQPLAVAVPEQAKPVPLPEHFVKGQGYYKLAMFRQAAAEFSVLVQELPDFTLGQVYLAMSHLRLHEPEEALRHFKLLVPLAADSKLKAISYHAMGCIHIQKQNMEQALSYFKLAANTDASFVEPSLLSKELWPYERT